MSTPLGQARSGGILDAKGAPTRRPAPLARMSDCPWLREPEGRRDDRIRDDPPAPERRRALAVVKALRVGCRAGFEPVGVGGDHDLLHVRPEPWLVGFDGALAAGEAGCFEVLLLEDGF